MVAQRITLLHTSDWHLGRSLYGKKRYDEHEQFLNWLLTCIEENQVELLIVAGDVFDTGTPSNRAQGLYYQFLARLAGSSCRHAVIVGGNHDSPSLLNAPQHLLQRLDVHVIGAAAAGRLEDELLLLRDPQGEPEILVCAVPYLRDRDVRSTYFGETAQDREANQLRAVLAHYEAVCSLAHQKRKTLNREIPIVATGHLFAAGGTTVDGDGVRELYVGSLGRVDSDLLPQGIDYWALGHLHQMQDVAQKTNMMYSGAPLPMSFAEAAHTKTVLQVCIVDGSTTIRPIEVPRFQPLAFIKGDWPEIIDQMRTYAEKERLIWLEICYSGSQSKLDLPPSFIELCRHSALEVLRVHHERNRPRLTPSINTGVSLSELSEETVFERVLDTHQIPPEQRSGLIRLFRQTVIGLNDTDIREE